MSPSPSALLTLSSSSKRSANPLHYRWAWHLMQGLSMAESTSSMALILCLKGFLRPGQSKTRYLTFFHSSSMGLPFLMAERVSENLPLPMKSSPSSWLLGQFLVKNLGKKKRLPFLEYMVVPVQKHRTPSSFSLIIHPVGSRSSLYVSASSTLMHSVVGLPSLEEASTQVLSASSGLSALRSLLAEEVFLLRWEMASSVISVMERTLPRLLSAFLGLVLLSLFSSSISTNEYMNLWLIALYPSLFIHSSSYKQQVMASSLDSKDRISKPSLPSSDTLVTFTFLPFTSSLMLSFPFSQYSPLKCLPFFSPFLTTPSSPFPPPSLFLAQGQMYPLVSLSFTFQMRVALAAATLAQSLSICSTLDSTDSLTLPTRKVSFLPSRVTSQNLFWGCSMQIGLDVSYQWSRMSSMWILLQPWKSIQYLCSILLKYNQACHYIYHSYIAYTKKAFHTHTSVPDSNHLLPALPLPLLLAGTQSHREGRLLVLLPQGYNLYLAHLHRNATPSSQRIALSSMDDDLFIGVECLYFVDQLLHHSSLLALFPGVGLRGEVVQQAGEQVVLLSQGRMLFPQPLQLRADLFSFLHELRTLEFECQLSLKRRVLLLGVRAGTLHFLAELLVEQV